MPPYVKQTWVDGVAGGTPISAARLNYIEDGIEDAAVTFNVASYSSVQACVTAAVAAGANRIHVPDGVWTLPAALSIVAPMTFVGVGKTRSILRASAAMTSLVVLSSSHVTFQDIGLESAGFCTSYILQLPANITNVSCIRTRFVENTGINGATAVDIQTGATDVHLTECEFVGISTLRIRNDAKRIFITRCKFSDWWDRAIFVLATSTLAPSNIHIVDNELLPPDPLSTGPRQPINIEGHLSQRVKDLTIRGNIVTGSNTAWINAATANGGTADQISLHNVERFTVANNISQDGGDVGITIAINCFNGTVSGNLCINNDTSGIDLGVTGAPVADIAVTGNTCMNNGRDRNGDHAGFVGLAGIFAQAASRLTISGNVCTDTQGTPTQLYGISIDNCSDINSVTESNIMNGNATASVNISGTNTRVIRTYEGSATWDPPSIPTATTTVTTLTVTGVVAGDLIEAVSFTSMGGTNLLLSADVQGANTVRVKLSNLTGVSQDLASGTVYVRVRKAV